MLKYRLTLFLALALSGFAMADEEVTLTDHLRASVKETLRPGFKDPDSLQIKNMGIAFSPLRIWVICGLANAKNSDGSYTEFRAFMVYFFKQSNRVELVKLAIDEEESQAIERVCKEDGVSIF